MKSLYRMFLSLSWLIAVSGTHAATVTWDGGGDGVSWTDTKNWMDDGLPTEADDVRIENMGTGVTITITNDVTLQNLQCSASLAVIGSRLSVTRDGSRVDADFIVESGGTLVVSGTNTTFTVEGPTTTDGASFHVTGGGVLRLPRLASYRMSGGDSFWQVSGAGST
ncbi:MAG TPA: hypothetical protein P5525_14890, partial [Candidatus Paceibacterota bacterium]|nr:hypothetical protein [Candidatus Paceibacterota bacterium]